MPVQASCPSCHTSYRLADEMEGKRVRCRRCEQPFLVERQPEPPSEEPEELDEAEPAPRKRASRSEPQRRPRPVEDPDNDGEAYALARPRRRRKQKGVSPALLIAGGVGAVVLLVLGVAVGVMVMGNPPSGAAGGQAQAPPPTATPQPAKQGPTPDPPAQAAANPPDEQPSVVLSNGRIGPDRFPGGPSGSKSFSMNYRFEKGRPAPGMQYFLVIKSPQGEGTARFGGHELRSRGTLNIQQIGFGRPPPLPPSFRGAGPGSGEEKDGPYEAWMEMGSRPGPFDQSRQQISNTITLGP